MSFWHDELWTIAYWSNLSSLPQVWQMLWSPIEGNLPLYPLFINVWTSIFGISEFSLVLPSLLAGSLTVVTIYLLARNLFSHFEGLVAAGLLAVLTTPIFFSLEVRCYSFIILFVTLNLLYKYSQKNVGWIVTSILLCWIHYFGIFFIALEALLELMLERKLSKKYLFPLVSLIPLVPLIYFQLNHGPTIYPDLALTEMAALPLWIFDSGYFFITIILSGLLIFMSLMVLLLKNWRKNHEAELLYFFGASVAVTLFTHFLLKSVYEERYLVIVIPAAVLLISRCLGLLRAWAPKTIVLVTLGLFLAGTAGALLEENHQQISYAKLKEGLDYISGFKECDKNLLVQKQHKVLWDYYLTRYQELHLAFNEAELKGPTFWLISMDIPDEGVQMEQAEFLARYKVVHRHQIRETEVVCFQKN